MTVANVCSILVAVSAALPELAPLRPYADERLLPVLPSLAELLPGGGLRRGSTVTVTGSTSLLLALLAGPSRDGSWCAAVGLPGLGLLAAAETGVVLARLVLVPKPGAQWLAVTAALLDGLDVVVVHPPARLQPTTARRLSARARERGAVLLSTGGWDGAEVALTVLGGRWAGLGSGHGRLRRGELDVEVTGRGAASRPRRAQVCLPVSTAMA